MPIITIYKISNATSFYPTAKAHQGSQSEQLRTLVTFYKEASVCTSQRPHVVWLTAASQCRVFSSMQVISWTLIYSQLNLRVYAVTKGRGGGAYVIFFPCAGNPRFATDSISLLVILHPIQRQVCFLMFETELKRDL